MLDPTLLLDKEDYMKLVEDSGTPKSSGNMMCYILDISEEKVKQKIKKTVTSVLGNQTVQLINKVYGK